MTKYIFVTGGVVSSLGKGIRTEFGVQNAALQQNNPPREIAGGFLQRVTLTASRTGAILVRSGEKWWKVEFRSFSASTSMVWTTKIVCFFPRAFAKKTLKTVSS